ncbi:hypothetical protein [Flavivirga eckloniae]|uniref:Outer membrane protein beta-barrel domain-containing protein n=1 Tax=Flavivirga eckloniae TaxID=1803846 RepID=A0A2K9PV44_9FLAO|nr:hypothetical protein [Flavivirga eckloniae]AUP80929.1 hypothetical protein C1H87_20335 [Flavivirga eckloniae]
MRKKIILCVIAISFIDIALAQESNPKANNQFRIGLQFGIGLGFDNIDLFIDEDNKSSSISAGGGLKVGFTTRYIFNKKYEIGSSFIFNSSTLRPELSNVSTSFNRISIQPTFKYLIGLNPSKDQTLNIGIGYGFYTGGKLKIDAGDLGLDGTLKYDGTSGVVLLTEYEFIGVKKFGALIGIKYYSSKYDNKQPIGDSIFDKLNGDGIDLYFGFTYTL